ncbi:DNA/RNA helicase domain-containing protein [Sediminicola sp. 1XM1-17]|uniref:DNA/RNA helicase domain-containing protein n=1 Tax=Sediminicola sp. 1XM1-17 TaxID=3127702 RepID=UPI003077E35F
MLNKEKLKSHYTVAELKMLSTSVIVDNIKCILSDKINCTEFSNGQVISWNKSIDLIKNLFEKNNKNWNIFFEFLIPLSSGKRPDILLTNGVTIFIVEVKNKSNYSLADLDQINGYKLDLEFYHSTATHFEFKPILLLLQAEDFKNYEGEVVVLSPNNLKSVLLENYKDYLMVNPNSLTEGNFKPVPAITEYAKAVFENKEIAHIEKACFVDSSQISIDLNTIYNETKTKKEHAIVFLTGTPGSGKSALGLKCAFNNNGLYVTKNRQFVENLNAEIGVCSNIKTSHNFLSEYSKKESSPFWNLVVFDEAQRFWSRGKMYKYFGSQKSESELVLDLYESREWCVLVVLIGDGQELGWGEYGGFYQWQEAINSTGRKWMIYGSEKTKKEIGHSKKLSFFERNNFDLSNSFRNFKTPSYPLFINKLLNFEGALDSYYFNKFKKEFIEISNNGFKLIITRNIDKAIEYCKDRYQHRPNSYCTLTSSESEINGIINLNFKSNVQYDYDKSSRLEINQYFNNNGVCDAYNGELLPLSEFSAIGFEIQMPIVVWGTDYIWYKNRWNYEFMRSIMGNTELRQNTYRILLTRGRDGVILYFPPIWQLNKTYEFFKELGASTI